MRAICSDGNGPLAKSKKMNTKVSATPTNQKRLEVGRARNEAVIASASDSAIFDKMKLQVCNVADCNYPVSIRSEPFSSAHL